MNADSAGIRYCFYTAALVFLRSVLYDKKIKEKEGERMTSRVDSVGLSGISGYPVMVECSISSGLPGFELVGLPDAAVRESRERVRAAIKNSGSAFRSAASR